MVIQHNIPAMTSQRNLGKNQNAISGNLEKLSSGYRINRAGDDAAGLAISEKMRCQITGLGAAMNNVEDGIGLIQTGDGAMGEIHDILNRMQEMGVLSANGTFDNETDRNALQAEADELIREINRISDSTNFNGIYMLKGSDWTEVNPDATGIASGIGSNNSSLAFHYTTPTFDQAGNYKSFHIDVRWAQAQDGDTITFFGDEYNIVVDTNLESSSVSGNTIYLNGSDITAGHEVAMSYAESVGADPDCSCSYACTASGCFSFRHSGEYDDDNTGIVLQIGDTNEDWNILYVPTFDMSAANLGVEPFNISTLADAQHSIEHLIDAVNYVSSCRAEYGANQNRLEHTLQTLSVTRENIQDAESTIRDTDVAKEMMEYTKNNILIQSSQSMLAQANQLPQGALQLLG